MARGRRVNSSGEKSKALLLEKAIEQFSVNGYHQTKISDIVKAANLTQPTFYLYFQSKESLFKDLNTAFKSQLFEVFNENSQSAANNPVDAVHESLKNIFTYFAQNPKLTKIGFFESEEAEFVKSEMSQHFVNMLQTDLALAKDVDENIVAASLLGSIERLTRTSLLEKECKPEVLADHLIDIYFEKNKVLVGATN